VPWALPQPIAELAALAAMSERSFMRHFRQATGTSPVHWLIGARVDRARELLESSTLSIGAIALHCGLGSAITCAIISGRRHRPRTFQRTCTQYTRVPLARSSAR